MNHQSVKTEIADALKYTAMLTFGATVLWLLMGIPIGIVSALKRRTWADRLGMTFALVGVSFPTFWLGYLLIFVFYYKLGWAPPTGVEHGDTVWDTVARGQFWLPWITLAFTSAAFYTRVVRGNMLETLSEDYIRTARAKGLSERRVTYKHALRAWITPVVTMLGLDVAGLLAGAVITEQVFVLPGLGAYSIRALEGQNFPPVMAVTLLAALFIVVANLVVDVDLRCARPTRPVRIGDPLPEPLLEVKDLRVHFPTEDGPGHGRRRGQRSRSRRARRSGSSVSPGRASRVSSLTVMGLIDRKQADIAGQALFRGQVLPAALERGDATRSGGAKVSMIFQDPMTSLHPVLQGR